MVEVESLQVGDGIVLRRRDPKSIILILSV